MRELEEGYCGQRGSSEVNAADIVLVSRVYGGMLSKDLKVLEKLENIVIKLLITYAAEDILWQIFNELLKAIWKMKNRGINNEIYWSVFMCEEAITYLSPGISWVFYISFISLGLHK